MIPRVLSVTNMYPTADRPSYGSFVASQIASLREQGVDTDVVFVDGRESRMNYVRGIREVQRKLAASRYDIVHAHFGLTGWVARFQRATPLVVSFCGDDLLGTPNETGRRTVGSLVMVASSHLLEPIADAIIVKSEEMRDRLLLSKSRARAVVLPNGVDLRAFTRTPQADARRQLGLDPRKRYVLFPNTPYELRKRVDLARAAVDVLAKRVTDVELQVVYHQPPALMPLYYSAADALLLTSDWEGSPNVVKEALACDLPIVSVTTGDVPERIRNAPGCEIASRDPGAIAAALERTLGSSRPALRRFVEPLDTRTVANRIIELYQAVLAARAS